MIRTWLSSFFKRNKSKMLVIIKYFAIIVLVAVVCAIFFSNIIKNESSEEKKDILEVYRPTKTVIAGSNVKQEEFEEEDNLIKTFVDYCNSRNFEQAYNLLSDECREKQFPTFAEFKENYCDLIFNEKKEYNMQSWINVSNYNTYKVSYIEDILLTGNYNDVKKYEDYITIKTDSNTKEKTLNINNFIKTEQINKKSEYEDLNIEIEVLYKDIYMTYESYKLRIINKSENDILLDDFTNISNNVKLVNSEGIEYRFRKLNAFTGVFAISSNTKKEVYMNFTKNFGADSKENYILLKRFIKDYSKYRIDKENYNEYKEIKINL